MMLFHNQTFEERLKFLELNLCDFPEELSVKDIDHTNPDRVKSGLKELQQLFAKIYKAIDMFKEDDPLESLHNVTYTLLFLYSAGVVGELCNEGGKWYLSIDKKQLKSHFKQSLSKPVERLQQFGFNYKYYKNSSCVETLNKCTHFTICCEQWDNITLALNYIGNNIAMEITNNDYTGIQGLFYKLDYRSMFLKESTKRSEINPFREDIIKTSGVKSEFLINLLKEILNKYPLKTKIKLHEFYTPHWVLQFYTKHSDKFAFNLNVAADTICLEIRLSRETVETLAERKMELLGQLRTEVDKFGCISCKNQCNKEYLEETNGVSYCTTYSEARLLMLYIDSEEDVATALMVLDLEIKNSNW